MKTVYLNGLLGALLLMGGETVRAQLINGNFATGNLTGWTYFTTLGPNTPYGPEQGGSDVIGVAQYDTVIPGVLVNSAELQAGQESPITGGGGGPAGAGFYQYVNLNAGQLRLSFNFAVFDPFGNADAGTFELVLDGTVVASDALGSSGSVRSLLSYTGPVAAGSHEVAMDVRRGYGFDNNTPYQYFSDFSLNLVPAPEPGTICLLSLGALLLGWRNRCRFRS